MERKDLGLEIKHIVEMIQNGNVSGAKLRLDELLAEHPDHPRLSHARAVLYANNFPPLISTPEMRKYCSKFPRDPRGPGMLAFTLITAKKYGVALKCLETAEKAGLLDSYGRNQKIAALEGLGRHDEAKRIQGEFSSEGKPSTKYDDLRAEFLANPPVTESDMLELADRFADVSEDPSWLACFKANWYVAEKMLEKAEATVGEALEANPLDSRLILKMARIDSLMGREDSVAERLIALQQRDPTNLETTRWVCQYYKRQRKYLAAVKTLGAHMKAMKKIGVPGPKRK